MKTSYAIALLAIGAQAIKIQSNGNRDGNQNNGKQNEGGRGENNEEQENEEFDYDTWAEAVEYMHRIADSNGDELVDEGELQDLIAYQEFFEYIDEDCAADLNLAAESVIEYFEGPFSMDELETEVIDLENSIEDITATVETLIDVEHLLLGATEIIIDGEIYDQFVDLDADGDNEITQQEIEDYEAASGIDVQSFLNDGNEDGVIDYIEFYSAIQKSMAEDNDLVLDYLSRAADDWDNDDVADEEEEEEEEDEEV